MNTTQTGTRIHPLMAIAAISVTLVSCLGIAALTGALPSSHSSAAIAVNQAGSNAPVLCPDSTPSRAHSDGIATRKTVTHTQSSDAQVAQSEVAQPQATIAMQQKPVTAPHNRPVGIGIGAVIGGLLGNQVGSGDGKTLATIAGAVGGGYVGNEVAKRNQ